MSNLPFSLKDAVENRYSMRTFTKQPVADSARKQILGFAAGIENPFGPKIRIKFIERATGEKGEKLGTYGIIKNAGLFLGVAVKNEPGAEEALGYEFEKLVLYMTSMGLGTCWIGGTFDKGAFAQAMQPLPDEIFTIISPVGYGTGKKRIFEKIMRSHIKADSRLDWEKLFFASDFSAPLAKSDAGDYAEALEYVRRAPSAVNKQPWRILYDGKAFHFYEAHTIASDSHGGFDIQRVDVGIALCHFHLAALEKNLSGRFEHLAQEEKRTGKEPLGVSADYITSWVID